MCKCTPEIRTPYCGRGNCINQHYKPQGARSQLPQDVEEFIAAHLREDPVTIDQYIDVDDLRDWMTDHVRVPVEFVDDAMCRTCYTHAAYMTNPCQWCIDREAMLDAGKEQS